MNTYVKMLAVLAVASLAGCSANDADAEAAAVGDDAEVVGASSYAAIEAAFGLEEGTPAEADVTRGECWRTHVYPVEGMPVFRVKQYRNGAIVFPADGEPTHSLCVDVYGKNAISADGFLLDTVLRYRLGSLTSVDGHEGSLALTFTKGTVGLFYSGESYLSGTPYTKTPDELPVGSGESIAGKVGSIVRKGVEIKSMGGVRTDDLHIDVEAASILYRVAWKAAVDDEHGSMETDLVGAFTGKAEAIGDVCCAYTTLSFEDGQLRYESAVAMDGSDKTTESVQVLSAGATVTRAECKREYVDAKPAYTCSEP